MKSPDIVVALKAVIRNVRKCGLKVLATVCDQSQPNVAAINSLKKETNRLYKKRNVENRLFGFELDGEEVIPLYDVPHLIKTIRNNLLEKDCWFHWK